MQASILRAPFALPKRAAAVGLRADVFAIETRAPYGRIAALAEESADVAAAGPIRGGIELRRHGSRASVLRG